MRSFLPLDSQTVGQKITRIASSIRGGKYSKEILRGLAVSLLFSILACAPTARDTLTKLQRSQNKDTLLPDIGRPISSYVLSVNSARRAALRNAGVVSAIVNALSDSAQVFIITNDRAAFTILHNPWPDRVRFIELPLDNSITIWPQDPFLVLDGGAASGTILASKDFQRAADSAMAGPIAKASGYRLQYSELFFEGGNIVSDSENVFIGGNTVRHNALQLNMHEAEVVLAFQEELGRKAFVIGPVPQPVGHIDMILTPLGEGRVALADAKLGIALAEKQVSQDPEEVEKFERYCRAFFFGHPLINRVQVKDGDTLEAPEVLGRTKEMIKKSRDIAPVLDGIAGALKSHGFIVERVPFLYGGPEASQSKESKVKPVYPMITYNNVLIEEEGGLGMVYLPSYGWEAMDAAGERTWQELGFKTRLVKGLAISAMYGGALRCSVKVLSRSPK